MQRRPKLTLTRPKEPAFETSQRVRSIKLKSSAEIEEEMMAKIPKFKARPVNRKVLFETSIMIILSRNQKKGFLKSNCSTDTRGSNVTSHEKKHTSDS